MMKTDEGSDRLAVHFGVIASANCWLRVSSSDMMLFSGTDAEKYMLEGCPSVDLTAYDGPGRLLCSAFCLFFARKLIWNGTIGVCAIGSKARRWSG